MTPGPLDGTLLNGFFRWLSLYANLAGNLVGDDREAMLAVWDDDEKFDKWLATLDAKRKAKPGAKGGKVSISQEEYLRKHANVYGGEET